MHRIEAELLIPGDDEPVRGGVVVLDGPRIGYAGPAGPAPPTPGDPCCARAPAGISGANSAELPTVKLVPFSMPAALVTINSPDSTSVPPL